MRAGMGDVIRTNDSSRLSVGGGWKLVSIGMALKLDPTLGVGPSSTNSVSRMKNEALLSAALSLAALCGEIGRPFDLSLARARAIRPVRICLKWDYNRARGS